MTFQEFKSFLTDKMRMSHIYQPVMIKTLLDAKGSASDREIATALLTFDPSQLEYYQKITNNMVGQVLRKHGIVEKNKNIYLLPDFEKLTEYEIIELISVCDAKIDSYVKKRGDAIWSHRRNIRYPVSGTIRYEVLKRAKFRCELCGISAAEKALEVDHITPKNYGGADSVNNYQALCYSCNATKGDRDNTDFRDVPNIYNCRNPTCLFCTLDNGRIEQENNLAYLIKDKYPVTVGHSLVIPKRHFQDYFEITQSELNSINSIMQNAKIILSKGDDTISGYNIGINSGTDAGQTIMHAHIHLIPRRKNDVVNPIGGIRNLIEGKGQYLSSL